MQENCNEEVYRYCGAKSLKGVKLMSDWDILTKILKYPDDEALKILENLNPPKPKFIGNKRRKSFETELKEEIVEDAHKSDINCTIDDVKVSQEFVQDMYLYRILEARSYKPKSSPISQEEIDSWKYTLDYIDGKSCKGLDLTGPITTNEIVEWQRAWKQIREMDLDAIRSKVQFLKHDDKPFDYKPYQTSPDYNPDNWWTDNWMDEDMYWWNDWLET